MSYHGRSLLLDLHTFHRPRGRVRLPVTSPRLQCIHIQVPFHPSTPSIVSPDQIHGLCSLHEIPVSVTGHSSPTFISDCTHSFEVCRIPRIIHSSFTTSAVSSSPSPLVYTFCISGSGDRLPHLLPYRCDIYLASRDTYSPISIECT